ncbi:MAG: hypothetical protein WC428_00150 [Candidatus Paceibacterota bacterium]
MSKKKSKKIGKLDEGFYIEAIDRAYIVANMMEDILIEHPVFIKHKELRKRVKKAQKLVLAAYQLIGGLEVKLFSEGNIPETK